MFNRNKFEECSFCLKPFVQIFNHKQSQRLYLGVLWRKPALLTQHLAQSQGMAGSEGSCHQRLWPSWLALLLHITAFLAQAPKSEESGELNWFEVFLWEHFEDTFPHTGSVFSTFPLTAPPLLPPFSPQIKHESNHVHIWSIKP